MVHEKFGLVEELYAWSKQRPRQLADGKGWHGSPCASLNIVASVRKVIPTPVLEDVFHQPRERQDLFNATDEC